MTVGLDPLDATGQWTRKLGVREIARVIGRSPSTVSRELTRNAATHGGKLEYRASVAQWKSELVARRPKPAKLVINPRLRQHVQGRLEGKIHDAQGREVAGPLQAAFIGRNKPHRGDRKWVNGWSPEQVQRALPADRHPALSERRTTGKRFTSIGEEITQHWFGKLSEVMTRLVGPTP
jgi:hypothetical protein